MNDSSFARLEYFSKKEKNLQMSEETLLLHVLSGSLIVESGGTRVTQETNDILLINASTVFELFPSDSCLYAVLSVSTQQLLSLTGRQEIAFQINASMRQDSSYRRLEAYLWRLHELALTRDNVRSARILSCCYEIAELMISAFMEEERSSGGTTESEKRRNAQIMRFIRSSYAENITLDMLAGELYLSNAYLSKYIKRRFGMNYMELLTSVRLSHAVNALLTGTDSITRVAMSCGFSSVAAFNRSFRETYGVSPSDYRKTAAGTSAAGRRSEDTVPEQLRAALQLAVEENRLAAADENDAVRIVCDVDALARHQGRLPRSWCKMVNAGTAYNLTRTDFQQQILTLKETLGFEYVRFWDVFSPELRISIHSEPQNVNFRTLFMVLDFLIDNGLKPFMELGIKPIRILRNTQTAVIDNHREDAFSSPEELKEFVAEFARQLVSRYGQREVSSWYFEYWKRDPLMYYVNAMTLTSNDERRGIYFAEFDALCEGIKSAVPLTSIGGGGFTFRSYGEEGMQRLIREWKRQRYTPDFVSVNCFQYINVDLGDGKLHQRRYSDPDYINSVLDDMHRIMRETGFGDRQVFVTEFGFTVSNRNVFNDSCSKAANLLQLLIRTMDRTDILAYWTALDAYSEYTDTSAVIFGGVGMLTKDGIRKPSYYSYAFLHRLDEEIFAKTEDYIVTGNGESEFKLVCHNFRGLTDEFYSTEEENRIEITQFPSCSADQKEKHVLIRLHNIPNGVYRINTREINNQYGAIQNVWQRFHYDDRLDRDDIDYIRQMCIPSMWRFETEVFDGTLEFDLRLAPNAIKYVHFVLKKG